jgi:hypothetical protein
VCRGTMQDVATSGTGAVHMVYLDAGAVRYRRLK